MRTLPGNQFRSVTVTGEFRNCRLDFVFHTFRQGNVRRRILILDKPEVHLSKYSKWIMKNSLSGYLLVLTNDMTRKDNVPKLSRVLLQNRNEEFPASNLCKPISWSEYFCHVSCHAGYRHATCVRWWHVQNTGHWCRSLRYW